MCEALLVVSSRKVAAICANRVIPAFLVVSNDEPGMALGSLIEWWYSWKRTWLLYHCSFGSAHVLIDESWTDLDPFLPR
jgi:hypothetical protein